VSLSVTVQNPTDTKAKGSKIELPSEVFDAKTNVSLIHQVVVAQLAAARQGTHKTKTRGEVRGGGKKPYRQKGTGRARQGSTRAPQFAGGGVVHGPVPRDYEQRTPKKMKAAALRGALSDRARNERLHVVSSLVAGDVPSTRDATEALAKVSTAKHVLVVVERSDELTWKSLRNIPTVHVLEPGQLNTYDVLISDDVVFTQAALDAFLAGPAKGKSAKGVASSDEVDEVDEVVETPAVSTEKPAAKKAPAKKAPAKKATAEKATAEAGDEVAPVSTEKPAAKKAPAKKAAAKKAEPKAEAEVTADEQDEETS
jgi:large subunit ribosomal protein L4